MYASIISMAGEEENKVFKVVEGPGKVDVTDDDPKMLKRFTDETGLSWILIEMKTED